MQFTQAINDNAAWWKGSEPRTASVGQQYTQNQKSRKPLTYAGPVATCGYVVQ